jgi:hypothetical protein
MNIARVYRELPLLNIKGYRSSDILYYSFSRDNINQRLDIQDYFKNQTDDRCRAKCV